MQPKRDIDNEELVASYHEIKDSLALLDILKTLDDQYETWLAKAQSEIDNGTKSVGLLQRAAAYDNMRVYIRGKLAEYS